MVRRIIRRKRSSVNEALGNTEAVRSLRHYGFRAYKISDVMGTSFTSKKPVDILCCSPKGRYVAIEGKIIKKWAGLNIKAFRENQIQELDGVVKRHGRAFVFLYVKIPRDLSKGLKKIDQLVVFDWRIYRNIIKKGISAKQMRERLLGVWLDPIMVSGKIVWPIKKLLWRRFK